jgi:hypothetical protein
VDGLATGVQRPAGWANQKVRYDAKRHAHTAQGVAVSTIHGDLLWCDGGWPGSRHEQELLALSGLDRVLDAARLSGVGEVQAGHGGDPAGGGPPPGYGRGRGGGRLPRRVLPSAAAPGRRHAGRG